MVFNTLNIVLILFIFVTLVLLIPRKRKIGIHQTGISLDISLTLRFISILFILLHHVCQRTNIVNHILALPFLVLVYLFVGLFFFLSGYGNYLSLEKSKNCNIWLIKRLVNLLFFFVIGFVINICINQNLYKTFNEVLKDFFTFTYKPATLWFFKVLFIEYILTYLLFRLKKEKIVLYIFVITIAYIAICIILHIPEYWWNSAIAYPLGMFFMKYKDKISLKTKYNVIFFLLFTLCMLATFKFIFLQPLATILFCYLVYSYCNYFEIKKITVCNNIGKCSLGIYLYHVVFLTYMANIMDSWYATLIILLLSIAVAFIVNFFYRKIEIKIMEISNK